MIDDYSRARKAGRRQVRDAVTHGRYPFLPALDEIVGTAAISQATPVGTINIPASLIAGTVTRARSNVFSNGFLPIRIWESEGMNGTVWVNSISRKAEI